MGYGAPANEAAGSVSGLYLDSKYYQAYPPGMKMTDGIPEDVMAVIDPHVSFSRLNLLKKLINDVIIAFSGANFPLQTL